MAQGRLNTLLRHIRSLAGDGGDSSDARLLASFARDRDDDAFAKLLHRHGRMVLGVCQRILRDEHEAEDACQATFLVLARKAGAKGWHDSIGNWLYGVARRIALKMHASLARRPSLHQEIADVPLPEPDREWQDLKPVLDEELSRLPDRARAALVLCYLEGLSNEEAASQLGCPVGTVWYQLSRGRDLLRRRLERRGIVLSAAALALVIRGHASAAALPANLEKATLHCAGLIVAGKPVGRLVSDQVAIHVKGVIKAMFVSKVKIAVMSAAVLSLCSLASLFTYQALAGNDRSPRESERGSKPLETPPRAKELFPEGTTHDFGQVPGKTTLFWQFRMKNRWAADLKIDGIRASSECITATSSTDRLKPGESATIDVTLDTRKFSGPKKVSVYVAGTRFTATLSISAHAREDLFVTPCRIDFGTVRALRADQAEILRMEVEYYGSLKDWKILGIGGHRAPVKVKIEEVLRKPTNLEESKFLVRYLLHFSLDKNAPAGKHRWLIPVRTNDVATPILPILVDANLAPATETKISVEKAIARYCKEKKIDAARLKEIDFKLVPGTRVFRWKVPAIPNDDPVLVIRERYVILFVDVKTGAATEISWLGRVEQRRDRQEIFSPLYKLLKAKGVKVTDKDKASRVLRDILILDCWIRTAQKISDRLRNLSAIRGETLKDRYNAVIGWSGGDAAWLILDADGYPKELVGQHLR